MPTYDYRCEATGQIFEVKHPMSVKAHTWAELCEIGGFEMGQLAADSSVTKLLTTGGVVNSQTLRNNDLPACVSGGGCPNGGCSG